MIKKNNLHQKISRDCPCKNYPLRQTFPVTILLLSWLSKVKTTHTQATFISIHVVAFFHQSIIHTLYFLSEKIQTKPSMTSHGTSSYKKFCGDISPRRCLLPRDIEQTPPAAGGAVLSLIKKIQFSAGEILSSYSNSSNIFTNFSCLKQKGKSGSLYFQGKYLQKIFKFLHFSKKYMIFYSS